MLNLIGKLPDPSSLLETPGLHLHFYGKAPRPGRKVGHITITAACQDELLAKVNRCQALLPAD